MDDLYRESNHRLNRVHEGALRITSEDHTSIFSDLVILLNEKTIHQKSINFLTTEVFKYLNELSPDLMNEVFMLKSNYHNLRNFNQFKTYNPKAELSLNSCVYRANQLWQHSFQSGFARNVRVIFVSNMLRMLVTSTN